ncbi:disulfide bond formation protein B [Candidatus Pelagibacter sp.]|nr:disulfide bond formation protein B [Candidatus Pelagibacter sp.]
MTFIKHKTYLSSILIFSIFAISTAYFIQYVLGHEPCNLCLIERIPFLMVIIITSLCLFFKKFEKNSLLIICLIFFTLTLISIYHYSIEQGFITESLVCEIGAVNDILTKEELLKQLNKRIVNCKDVTFEVLGLSLATINIFISLALSIITLKLFLNYEKNK